MEAKRSSRGFAALGAEVRLEVLRFLIRQGPSGAAAGEISTALGIAPPTMSFHLKDLANADLVVANRRGRNVIYAADYAGVRALVETLLIDCCQGDPRLCGPYVIREPAN